MLLAAGNLCAWTLQRHSCNMLLSFLEQADAKQRVQKSPKQNPNHEAGSETGHMCLRTTYRRTDDEHGRGNKYSSWAYAFLPRPTQLPQPSYFATQAVHIRMLHGASKPSLQNKTNSPFPLFLPSFICKPAHNGHSGPTGRQRQRHLLTEGSLVRTAH